MSPGVRRLPRAGGGAAEAAGPPWQSRTCPPPQEARRCLSLSRPRKTSSPGAVAFKHCQSSHFKPRPGASSASVVMTQPELYLEASDVAPCPGPSQSDRRFPEHLGLRFKCPSSQGMGVEMTLLIVRFLLREGSVCGRRLSGSRSPSAPSSDAVFNTHGFYKACKTWQRQDRIMGKSVRTWVWCCVQGPFLQRCISLELHPRSSESTGRLQ